ncbi:hypothetical protein THAOC_32814 [Thalassiosira oceanica]|uniref:Uncharacterized protein n=1 Tax=Thalassiosira oceanica TaxID=159749 RepID=K0R6D7_THAOC|nr:hypothetical protein THAOC_32814 [Thalassiosira oceanica]|eukprot:EJK48390.1 hypothetical protein THAOC_32814 [Thalassiosira oceanica]
MLELGAPGCLLSRCLDSETWARAVRAVVAAGGGGRLHEDASRCCTHCGRGCRRRHGPDDLPGRSSHADLRRDDGTPGLRLQVRRCLVIIPRVRVIGCPPGIRCRRVGDDPGGDDGRVCNKGPSRQRRRSLVRPALFRGEVRNVQPHLLGRTIRPPLRPGRRGNVSAVARGVPLGSVQVRKGELSPGTGDAVAAHARRRPRDVPVASQRGLQSEGSACGSLQERSRWRKRRRRERLRGSRLQRPAQTRVLLARVQGHVREDQRRTARRPHGSVHGRRGGVRDGRQPRPPLTLDEGRDRVRRTDGAAGGGRVVRAIDVTLLSHESWADGDSFCLASSYSQLNVEQGLQCFYREVMSLRKTGEISVAGKVRVAAFLPRYVRDEDGGGDAREYEETEAVALYDYGMALERINEESALGL